MEKKLPNQCDTVYNIPWGCGLRLQICKKEVRVRQSSILEQIFFFCFGRLLSFIVSKKANLLVARACPRATIYWDPTDMSQLKVS